MNFRKISEGGGGWGHFRSKEFHCNFFCFRKGNFGHEFPEKASKRGGGQGPFGYFPEIHRFSYAQASLTANLRVKLSTKGILESMEMLL